MCVGFPGVNPTYGDELAFNLNMTTLNSHRVSAI
jgi:hypothetical protein